jgi:hypothetical protein
MYATTDRTPRAPSWAVLYLLAALLVGGVGLVEVGVAPGAWRRMLELAVCVAGFAAIYAWLRAERCALDRLGPRQLGIREIPGRPLDQPMGRAHIDAPAAGLERASVAAMNANGSGRVVALRRRSR